MAQTEREAGMDSPEINEKDARVVSALRRVREAFESATTQTDKAIDSISVPLGHEGNCESGERGERGIDLAAQQNNARRVSEVRAPLRLGWFEEVWTCPQPPTGTRFRVLSEEWNDDYTVRTIHRITRTAEDLLRVAQGQ